MTSHHDEGSKTPGTPEEQGEPHLADPGNLADAAQWLVGAVVSGVIGNATYDLIKALVDRHSRRKLMAKVREILPGKAAAMKLEPRQIEERVEQALNKAEEEE
ncbi:hypothetical protein WME95_04580 [Sorangium sp. So ce327]|jgi:hypothetical protein|uniref:hypothetical protein n=1 Tax=Sorangium sp. So ce327 TaxID=3133301 RepID=UPI003F5F3D4E